MNASGALIGLMAGAGAATAIARLPGLRRPTLAERVDPYVATSSNREASPEVRTVTPFPTLEKLFGAALTGSAHRLDAWLGGRASLRKRLERAGLEPDVDRFRVEQVMWAAAALIGSVGVTLLLVASGKTMRPIPVVLLAAISATLGAMLRERWLDRTVRRREAQLVAEFPTMAELIALSVAAGEGAGGALERFTNASNGELSRELARTLADVRVGAGLVDALRHLADRTAVPALARFVDGVVIAVERGTPLAEVLRAQAADVRESGRRALLETAGKREIAMMVPVVFLVLPITVLFALFPGFYGLSLSTP